MDDIGVNEHGEKNDCAFHKEDRCNALKTWYKLETGKHCEGCPFLRNECRLMNV